MTTKSKPKTKPDEQQRPQHWLNDFKFKPGQSGNPSGRPKKKPVTEAYEEDMLLPAPDHVCDKLGLPRGSSLGRCAARATMLRAITGKDVGHVREVTDRLEGRAAQSVSVKHEFAQSLVDTLRQRRQRVGMKK